MKTPEEIKKGLECCAKGKCRYECPFCLDKYDVSKCTSKLTKAALAFIQNLESLVPRWIPVEERLPEDNGEYLVSYKSVSYKSKKQAVVQYEVGYGFWRMTSYYEGFDQVLFEGVTHWMPLPEPPEVNKP